MGRSRGSWVWVVVAAGVFVPSAVQGQVFTPAEKQTMLTLHNEVRCEVSPTAQSMPALTWSLPLELTAQTWANLCIDMDHNGLIDHNPNRSVGHPYYVGENIYATGGIFPTYPEWAVNYWAAEKMYYNFNANTCAVGQVCGHYTQLVWANTLEVGCARALCPGLSFQSVVVCNYGPGGNYSGQRPYVAGSGVNAACGGGSDLIFADGFESD
jgi:uncharacterized protein YkwD